MRTQLLICLLVTSCSGEGSGDMASAATDATTATTASTATTEGTTTTTVGTGASTSAATDDSGTATDATTGTAGGPYAQFHLFGDDYNDIFEWSEADGNLVSCRNTGETNRKLLFAQDVAADGGDGPLLEINLCTYTGSGTYQSTTPWNGACMQPSWDVTWEDGPDTAYANSPNAEACELNLVETGDTLEGTFACDLLEQNGGNATLAINEGAFRCTVVPG